MQSSHRTHIYLYGWNSLEFNSITHIFETQVDIRIYFYLNSTFDLSTPRGIIHVFRLSFSFTRFFLYFPYRRKWSFLIAFFQAYTDIKSLQLWVFTLNLLHLHDFASGQNCRITVPPSLPVLRFQYCTFCSKFIRLIIHLVKSTISVSVRRWIILNVMCAGADVQSNIEFNHIKRKHSDLNFTHFVGFCDTASIVTEITISFLSWYQNQRKITQSLFENGTLIRNEQSSHISIRIIFTEEGMIVVCPHLSHQISTIHALSFLFSAHRFLPVSSSMVLFFKVLPVKMCTVFTNKYSEFTRMLQIRLMSN